MSAQNPLQILPSEIIEIDDSPHLIADGVIEIQPCPESSIKSPLRINYKAGCASILSKYSYPDYFDNGVDLVQFAIQLIRRHGYRVVRRTDSGSSVIIEFVK